jgi:hypothetical protein
MSSRRADDDRGGQAFDAAGSPGQASKQEIRTMRRRLATLAAMSVLALALSAAPALAGSPATHDSWLATDAPGPLPCGANTYMLVAGTINQVLREGTSASGNVSFTETITAHGVVAENVLTGAFYRVVGVEHFGFLANAGSGQMTWMFKMQILGTGDSLNVVYRFAADGSVVEHNVGTCSAG